MRQVFSRLARASVLIVAICGSAAEAAAERIALLIGNAAYAEPRLNLLNPENDVDALAPTLEELGFEVAIARNASAADMRAALARFATRAEGADIALVFFAGHGVQIGERNLLIGSGLDALTVEAAEAASVTLADITRALDTAAPRSAMILVDACRNNPLMDTGTAPTGLAVPRRRPGTLIAYATDPGNVAFDGSGENSTFTAALLRHIATPGLDVRIMLGRVRQQVVRETAGAQVPWVEEAILDDLTLVPGTTEDVWDAELAAWIAIQEQDSAETYRAYLSDWPDGLFSRIARNRISELDAPGAPGPGTPPQSLVAAELGPEEFAATVAALELTGLVATRGFGSEAPSTQSVQNALNQWAAARDAGEADLDTLLDEGARLAVFLGTYAAGVLRKDLQSFAAVEETLAIAERDMAAARASFGADPAAVSTLSAMEVDLAQMHVIRDDFARRLDESRSYYHDLITTVREHFTDRMSLNMVPRHGTTRASVVVPSRAFEDAQAFLRQVDLLTRAPSGSYLWLTDFLED